MPESFEVGSLSEDELKEFQEASVEDTASIEKKQEIKPEKSKEKAEVKEETKEKEVKGKEEAKIEDDNKEVGTLTIEDYETENGEKGKAEPEDKNLKEESDKEEVALDYNAIYKRNIKKGFWVAATDEEGNEVEIQDEDTFIRMMDWQNQNAAENTLKEREAEFGDKYQLLVTHLKNGGQIEELAGTYQQEKDIDDIDTSTVEGAEEILKFYYSSLPGWDKNDVEEQIESIKDKGEESLKSNAEKRKASLKESIKEDRERIVQEQEVQAKRLRDYQENYNKELKKAIHTLEVPERDKKDLEKFYYEVKNQVEGGKASDFYLKFEEAKSNPAKWLKVIQFFKDMDNFQDKKTTEKNIKTSIFKSMRGENAKARKTSETPEPVETKVRKEPPQTFKKFYNSV